MPAEMKTLDNDTTLVFKVTGKRKLYEHALVYLVGKKSHLAEAAIIGNFDGQARPPWSKQHRRGNARIPGCRVAIHHDIM
jgi:hypothetical protein